MEWFADLTDAFREELNERIKELESIEPSDLLRVVQPKFSASQVSI
jgi:hypothetical protein